MSSKTPELPEQTSQTISFPNIILNYCFCWSLLFPGGHYGKGPGVKMNGCYSVWLAMGSAQWIPSLGCSLSASGVLIPLMKGSCFQEHKRRVGAMMEFSPLLPLTAPLSSALPSRACIFRAPINVFWLSGYRHSRACKEFPCTFIARSH